jgi:hypothetical protein
MASSTIPFLIWLLCIGISAILIGYALKVNNFGSVIETEGFITNISMSSCPPASNEYITPKGDTYCCDAELVNGKCPSQPICSLSPTSPTGIITCSNMMNSQWADRSRRFCPKSMPNYFGPINRNNKSNEGCSASKSSSDGSVPTNIGEPKCKIYSTEAEEYSKIDSCFNRKELDAMVSIGTKNIINTHNIALFTSTGIPADGSSFVPVTCYDYNRVVKYLQSVRPDIADKLKADTCFPLGVSLCGISCDIKDTRPKYTCVVGKGNASFIGGHNGILKYDNSMTDKILEEKCNNNPKCKAYVKFKERDTELYALLDSSNMDINTPVIKNFCYNTKR